MQKYRRRYSEGGLEFRPHGPLSGYVPGLPNIKYHNTLLMYIYICENEIENLFHACFLKLLIRLS